MPDSKQRDSQHDRQKLERAKVHLSSAEFTSQPLSCLGQAEDGPQVDEQRCGEKGRGEQRQSACLDLSAGTEDEDGRQNDKDANGKDLVGQAAEQDVVCRRRVFPLLLPDADEGCTDDLRGGGDDVGRDEEPQDDGRRE